MTRLKKEIIFHSISGECAWKTCLRARSSVVDPWHFGTERDPDPLIRTAELWIQIRIRPRIQIEHIMTNPDGPKKFGSDGSRSGSGPQHSSEESKCLVDRVEDVWKRLWVAKAEDKKCMSKTHFNLVVFIFFVIWTQNFLHWSIIRKE